MPKYRVKVSYGDPGKPKNSSQIITVEASSEGFARTDAVNKFINSNPTYRNKEAVAVSVELIK